jgi:hypothetical protein
LHLRRHFNTCNLIAPDGKTWKIRLHNVETWPYYLPEYSFYYCFLFHFFKICFISCVYPMCIRTYVWTFIDS